MLCRSFYTVDFGLRQQKAWYIVSSLLCFSENKFGRLKYIYLHLLVLKPKHYANNFEPNQKTKSVH